ncbi:DUF1294 domain-containing protein [Streptococcus sp. DD10]|uniref:DUF1294 domain-containing protein n=1 Tax=Streptococcus sp. DD10 TaxID=1777878 RepID=UPI0008305C14|nr:DUF1294 domain-containing protein [Streptococcus sp. DD10]
MREAIFIILLGLNIVSFCFYGWDKRKAVKNQYRISEKQLLLFTFLGGGVGAFLAGHLFRHKIRKWYFQLSWYLSILIDFILIYWIWRD